VIVHYDFQSIAASRDEANTSERLKGLLPPERRDEARRTRDYLVAKVGEMIPAGGGAFAGVGLKLVWLEGSDATQVQPHTVATSGVKPCTSGSRVAFFSR
jgi:hypothetical protein